MSAVENFKRNLATRIEFARKVIGPQLTRELWWRVFDVICGLLVVAKIVWYTVFLFAFQLYFQYEHFGITFITVGNVFWACWLVYSVVYHYWKCRMAEPVRMLRNSGFQDYCSICRLYKSRQAVHCETCGKCVFKRDHHCSLIGQCIGTHNQAHFFLLLWSVLLATATLVYDTTYWGYQIEQWQHQMLYRDKLIAGTAVALLTLHIVVIFLFCSYFFIISGGSATMKRIFVERTNLEEKLSKVRRRLGQHLLVRYNQSIPVALFVPSDRVVHDFDFFSY